MNKEKLIELIESLAEQYGYDCQWYNDISTIWDILYSLTTDCADYKWPLVINSARIDSAYDDTPYLVIITKKLEQWWWLMVEEWEGGFDSVEELADGFIEREKKANELLDKYKIKIA